MKQKYTIGNKSMIIKLLRDHLYSDPINGVIKEYISNARDAHKEAKIVAAAKDSATRLESMAIKIGAKVGESGKIFGCN